MQGGARPNAGRKSLSEEQRAFEEIYQFLPEAVEFLRECFSGHNVSLKKWATEVTLKRTIPERKAVEVSGEGGGAINVNIINDYISKPVVNAPPAGGIEGQNEIQDPSMAQESKKDINSTGEGCARSV